MRTVLHVLEDPYDVYNINIDLFGNLAEAILGEFFVK